MTGDKVQCPPAIGPDGTVYFGSDDKKLYALDAAGNKKWEFATRGPVATSPALDAKSVYFTSVDGYLYVLNNDGSLRWKFRGLPEGRRGRKVLGHGRLISLWPARGGPVLADGILYAGTYAYFGAFDAADRKRALDLLEFMLAKKHSIHLPPGSRVMETGGYKGRSRTIPKSELHSLICQRLGVPLQNLVSEYGMSELSSQAYDVAIGEPHGEVRIGCGVFRFPPWTRVRLISPLANSCTSLLIF